MKSALAKAYLTVAISALLTAGMEEWWERRTLRKADKVWERAAEVKEPVTDTPEG
jgi:hypothetical protein